MSVVVLLHLLLGWALVNGLARKVVEVIKAPIETKIIEEVKPPPPPPPENLPPPPKFAPPPPSFVPPPEVQVNPPPTPAPTITTTQVAPPPGAGDHRAGHPRSRRPRHRPRTAGAARAHGAEAGLQRLRQTRIQRRGAPGRRARHRGRGLHHGHHRRDQRRAVEKSSGMSREHKMLDRMTLEAVQACKGTPGTLDGKPEKLSGRIEYVWRLTD